MTPPGEEKIRTGRRRVHMGENTKNSNRGSAVRHGVVGALAAILLLAAGAAFAQDTNELIVVGSDGRFGIVRIGNFGEPAPIVMMNGTILSPGDLDCEMVPNHPQCRTLDALLAAEKDRRQNSPQAPLGAFLDPYSKPDLAPGVILVTEDSGAVLIRNAAPSDYPPPVVIVDGVVVNR
jgi:hypothetical protein